VFAGSLAVADTGSLAPSTLQLPWTPTSASARKGIAWKPSAQANLDPARSDILLTAIARARSWMNDLSEGRVNSFEEIARSENKVERHIRHLAPLAFVSPRIVEAIANGSAPADLTVTRLARGLPHGWAAQEHKLGKSWRGPPCVRAVRFGLPAAPERLQSLGAIWSET
jgi:site-specific DNA recombinase